MDTTFRRLLEEAAKIRAASRRTGDSRAHAGKMVETLGYAQAHDLFTGNVPAGTANEENLAQATEMAAFILEVIHREEVFGPVLNLSREQKMRICRRAEEKALAHIAAHRGR